MNAKLLPIIHPRISGLIKDNSQQLYSLIELLGSPLHIVFPEIMQYSINCFRDVLQTAGMNDGNLYFAAKANKANSFLAMSAKTGIGVDVSSVGEFVAALQMGVPGKKISVSGPTKHPALLALSILHNARITIDEPTELSTITELIAKVPTTGPVRICLRLSATNTSRFGMTTDVLNDVIVNVATKRSVFQLEGFSFHVSGYDTQERVRMIQVACKAISYANACGLKTSHINIGGGLRTSYSKPSDWNLNMATDREFVGGNKPQFIYPYASEISGYTQLNEIIEQTKQTIQETSDRIGQSLMIDLEPGRSLLDQAGITIFRVRGIRPIGNKWVLIVDGNSRSLAEFWRNSEFFTDPLLISKQPGNRESFSCAIASNTCLENDYLARRFVPFAFRPAPGDLLVYVNTAGYQMDSKESEFHRLPIPAKVAGLYDSGVWHFINDSIISVTDFTGRGKKENGK